ncbi:MAG: acriflavin resistance protein [Rhodospirillales bacterium]|nr:acriflavin resistance protein [Rhodospirillales bacterium]
MGIVKFALRFPHTFYVVAVLILFLGISAIVTTPTDIFPQIRIPVVSVIWQYTALSPDEMEARVATYSEYSISSTVNGIKDMESQTLSGIVVQKIYFQPNVNLELAISQIVSATNSIRALMPPGINPPVIVQFNASSVPILQLSLSSDQLNEQQLYDYGIYQVRQQLAPIPGITLPTPYGGKYRQIMVDLDPKALLAQGLTPTDVTNAVNAQNLTVPSGDAKIGDKQYIVKLNAQPQTVAALNDIPIRQVNGTTVYLRDVAHVRDAWAVQQNIVRTGGKRSVLLTIIKNGEASTLDVVNRVKAALPGVRAAAPPGMEIKELFDQSVFVSDSINAVLREGAIAAGLTALMILMFLGSWRSTVVVMVSIPLSILTSIAILSALGETINTMTLGGLALAVGILVDDSTVTIENTHRLLDDGHPFDRGVLEGAAGIAVPTLVSTLAISCVFISVVFLDGAPRYLFTPQGMAVVFAMLASYGLSRTLTPIIIRTLLRREHEQKHDTGRKAGWFGRFHEGFNHRFERFRTFYVWLLGRLLTRRLIVPAVAGSVIVVAAGLAPFVGRDFFPSVDAGVIQLHVRAPARTRIEETEKIFQAVENQIRDTIPENERDLILDNIGLPQRTINLAFTDGSAIGVNDGVIQVALKPGHAPTADYVKRLREELPAAFPDVRFYFQPADMVTQILNFGVPTQVDVEVVGHDRAKNLELAQDLQRRMSNVPGAVDVHLQQETDAPELYYSIDRTRAQELGQTVSAISNNLMISLSSSEQVFPNFWTDTKVGIPYYLAVQTPEYRISSLNDLNNIALSSTSGTGAPVPDTLGNVAQFERKSIQSVINHSNVQPVYDIYASVQDRDLGGVASAIDKIVAQETPKLAPGNHIVVRGQIESMNSAFSRLTLGLIFAAVFVYLLMVVNFQDFLDPFVVILALLGAACGIIVALFITGTTLSVPSLMGAIMSIGVASANSILLVTFAREQSLEGKSPIEAAIAAGGTRLRPVLMTAAAMIVGMLPMAIGGAGEEQNAVLARAVIGGLLFGTCTTLLVVPYLYALLRRTVGEHKRNEIDFGESTPSEKGHLA